MKQIKNFITEKLHLNKSSVLVKDSGYTDEELRQDYKDVEYALTKAEKQKYASKYHIQTNKFREIQLEILKYLQMNRQNKKEFNLDDLRDFWRFDFKEKEFLDHLKEEPIEFVQTLYINYDKNCKSRNIGPYANSHTMRSSNLSIADRYLLRKYEKIKKYLNDMGELPK